MHAEAERRAVCCELISEVARSAGEVRLKLLGTSMLPAMWPGDVVTVQRCGAADIQRGEVVVYRAETGLVAHRAMRVSGGKLITRGDAVPQEDRPVQAEAIVGRVTRVVRDGRDVSVGDAWRHRMVSWVLRRSSLCLRIMLRLTRKRDADRAFVAAEAA